MDTASLRDHPAETVCSERVLSPRGLEPGGLRSSCSAQEDGKKILRPLALNKRKFLVVSRGQSTDLRSTIHTCNDVRMMVVATDSRPSSVRRRGGTFTSSRPEARETDHRRALSFLPVSLAVRVPRRGAPSLSCCHTHRQVSRSNSGCRSTFTEECNRPLVVRVGHRPSQYMLCTLPVQDFNLSEMHVPSLRRLCTVLQVIESS